MKQTLETEKYEEVKISSPLIKGKRSLRRFSPFLWLSVLLFLFFLYSVITKTGTQTQIILCPFIIANMAYADFALWSYFQKRKKYLIWVLELLISAIIIYLYF